MNTGVSFKLLLRVSLGVLFLSLGLFSAAYADRNVATVAPAVKAAKASPAAATAELVVASSQAQSQAAVSKPQQCGQDAEPSAESVLSLPLSLSATQVTCGSGTALTCCSCGCGCRPSNISPQNFCRFFFCPGP
jgi:hypothetical protein